MSIGHVRTLFKAVGQGCVRFSRLCRHTVGEMSGGKGSKGDDGSGDVVDSKLGCPAIVNDHDLLKVILGVTQQDGFAVEGDFANCFVKKAALHRTGTERRLLTRPGSR